MYEVDHIKPLMDGGDNIYPDNYQLLCPNCHRVKTILERSRDGDIYNHHRWGDTLMAPVNRDTLMAPVNRRPRVNQMLQALQPARDPGEMNNAFYSFAIEMVS